jgi:hypothetical protein|tara:strand:- start:106 stop:648 length:543 start_codon:yes stop_codon:yes gene_type:complete
MKDIRVKQTNLILEKKVEKDIFYNEAILENIDTKSLIKDIEIGISSNDNMNYKTNVHGKMTSWTYFNNNEHINEIISKCLDLFKLDSKIPNSYLAESWGIKMSKNSFTKEHDHAACTMSGVLYLNTVKNYFLDFPELNYRTEIIKNKIVIFHPWLLHKTSRLFNITKYAVAFNFKKNKNW